MKNTPGSERFSPISDITKEKKSGEQIASLRRAGAMLLILIASMAGRSESTEPYKPEGPYAARAQMPSPYEEATLGKLATPLELSDTFDGAISTVGYAVLFDRQKISKALARDEVAVLEQIEYGQEDGVGYKYITREIIGNRDVGGDDPGIAHDHFTPSGSTDGGFMSWPDKKMIAESTGLEVLGGGIDMLSEQPAEVILATHRRLADDIYELIDKRTAALSVQEEIDCNNELSITSEVVLTPKQIATLCEVIDEYDSLLPRDARIAADYITHPDDAADSADNQSIQLSYPAPADIEWPRQQVDATLLHEALHTAYRNLPKNAPARIRADKVYTMIIRNMTYQLPDLSQAPFEKSVAVIEPIWGVITESSYSGEHPSAGHPWGRSTEMVSSTMSVVTYHTEEFLDKFKGLPAKQQKIIRSAVNASYDVFIAAGGDSENVLASYEKVRSGMSDLMRD